MDDSNKIAEEAIELAGNWQSRANELRTRRETARHRKFARLFETLARIAAVIITGCKLRISSPEELDTRVTRFLGTKEGQRLIGGNPVVYELDKGLIKSLPIIDRIRYAAPKRVPRDVSRAAADVGFYIARAPVMMNGRIELLQYYRQQSICNNFHRYGNLGERAPEFE